MNIKDQQKKIPIWFWVVSGILLLWNLMGIANFFQYLFMSEETLQAMPQSHQKIIQNMPVWIFVVFGIAVFSGVGGSIALLLKRKAAKALFIMSLIASLVQMGRSVIEKDFEVYGTAEVVITLMIIGVLIFAIWFSQYVSTKNWIR